MPITLTNTSLSTARRCPREYHYRYELAIARPHAAQALRFGGAYHLGLEHGSIDAIDHAYATRPDHVGEYEWEIEHQKCRTLFAGYQWRYEGDEIEYIARELPFRIPLTNPATGRKSSVYELAGKIDAIVRWRGATYVMECKTAGEDIGADSEYWPRLRCDPQVSMYVMAAKAIGHDVSGCLYDVTRKPTIEPHQIPVLDADGFKIVEDAAGNRVFNKTGKPRESASSADGWKLRTSPESPDAYAARFLADIGERPDHYFARREVTRTDGELAAFARHVWLQARMLNEARKCGAYYPSVSPMNCDRRGRGGDGCPYRELCYAGWDETTTPSGFVVLDDVHPELKNSEQE